MNVSVSICCLSFESVMFGVHLKASGCSGKDIYGGVPILASVATSW
jgi:hypothetical protein